MKQKTILNMLKHLQLVIVSCLTIATISNAQKVLLPNTKAELQKIYNRFKNPEVSFEKFAAIYKVPLKKNNPSKSGSITNANAKINDCSSLHTLCGNGDFESGNINTLEWRGGYGTWGGGQPDPFSLTEGFNSGPINDFNSHQTIVGIGADPIVGIPQVAPDGGNYSLRLGNDVNNYGTEFISKTFVVDANKSIFPFRYALVFQDPGHAPTDQPAFSVKAYDCNGTELTGICDLGNGSNIAVSNHLDPFFQPAAGGAIAYRDWSQAQINLSAYVGQTVTIVFLNKDCGLGGHYGYSYIDNLCTVCTNGCQYTLSVNSGTTSSCGVGKICLDYSLPVTGNNTGDVIIDLDIYQNGAKVGATQASAKLTSGTSYCFNIDPSTLGLNTAAGGFDYVVTGHFSLNGFPLSPIFVGSPPNGQIAGANNDYLLNNTTAVCKNATVTLVNGSASITPADVDGGSTYCGGKKSSTVSPSTFNCSNIGNNTVTLTVTDNNNNVSTCTATVNVLGTIPSCSITAVPTSSVYTGGVSTNIYLGYGPQNVKLSATPTSGVTYSWSPTAGLSSASIAAPIFTPTLPGTYLFTLTVTNSYGCTSKCTITICVLDVRVPGTDGKKINICHFDNGKKGSNSIEVSINAVSTHIFSPGHGDYLGKCGQVPCTLANARYVDAVETKKTETIISALKMSVLPNPSSGQFNLQLNNLKGSTAEVSVIDANGIVIEKKNILVNTKGNTVSFNLRSKAAGRYYIKVVSEDGVQTEKIVIQR
jgi:hypothetical protein